ncbi:hypothetical protein PF007_g9079 [Phytophthora fragariae]|uniref:Uncharacterized protein n=1 Tax=Phytophthora fragariae TaxID=53985 RepID=A0A6A3SMT4_9STRA|nr:hypothetical protein PF007_g9079 [Phytophthora fragariae]KAE9314281.1 hypothetical protein PF001_g8338 [Phytophthora fragariae]
MAFAAAKPVPLVRDMETRRRLAGRPETVKIGNVGRHVGAIRVNSKAVSLRKLPGRLLKAELPCHPSSRCPERADRSLCPKPRSDPGDGFQQTPEPTPSSEIETRQRPPNAVCSASPVGFDFADHRGPVREPVVPSFADIGDLTVGDKPNRKNITVDSFSGFLPVSAFNSSVRRWWQKCNNQLTDAQILDHHRWTDVQCRSIFGSSLCGDAADWVSEVRVFQPDLTRVLAGETLVEKYKSKLPEHELLNRLMTDQKARGETYQAYAQRLLNMADSLPGGLTIETNARYLMYSFIKRAYYKYSDALKSFVERLPPTILGDVPAAYLKAKLKDTVYVKPVKEFEKP